MADNKRYYWIKLKTDFFNQETIDFLLSQKNGCEYIVLYQMLCLITANNNGEMSSKIGEMIVPYNIEKIVRDTKYFDFDTVTIAMGLFKQLGLIYEEEDKILRIANFDEMVGSEAGNANAQRQKRFRERQKQLKLGVTNSNGNSNTKNNEEIEYRDRDKSIEIDIDKDIESSSTNLFTFLEENFGRTIAPIEYEQVEEWCKYFKNEEIIKYAITLCCNNNAKNINYLNAILRSWEQKGYKKLEECKNESLSRQQKAPTRKEVVPEWLDKETKKEEENDEEFLKEWDEFLKDIKSKDDSWKKEAEELQSVLKETYGKD